MIIEIVPSKCGKMNFIDIKPQYPQFNTEIDLTDDEMQKVVDVFTAYLKDKDNKK